ncbi:MAG TPA: glycosyltransferase, partial [Planctomycetota bacterium]|nr:glycosyltransferase [Planctomycetota bacterium]
MPQNEGFAAGCNAGIHVATSPFVAILNDDARAGPRTFTKLVEHCERQARVGFVGPRSNYVKGRQCWTDTAGLDVEDVEAIEARFEARFAKRCEDVSYLAGLCLLARRTTWLALDGFDDAFGLGNFEDDDLCLRSRLAGHRLLVAHDAYVWHEGSATFGESGIDYGALMRKQRELFLQRWRESPLAHAEVASFYGQHEEVLERAHELRALEGHARAWAAAPLARAHESVGANDAAAAEWARVLRLAPCHVEAWTATALHALAGDEDCKADELFAFIEAELPMDRLERARLDTERARLHAMRRRPADDARADALLDHALACVADYLPAREVSAALALARGDLRAA